MVQSKRKNLLIRLVSAVIIVIPSLWAIITGVPAFNILLALFGAAMAWEWVRLCNATKFTTAGSVFVVSLPILCLLPVFDIAPQWGAYALLFGCAAFLFIAHNKDTDRGLLSLGVFYLGLSLMGFLMLREQGWELIAWLCGVVIATDTGAYLAGSTIGGPKIAPRISPNKTWAGLIGGMISAAVLSYCTAIYFGWAEPFLLLTLGAVLAIVAQLGDFFESHLKRRAGMKDSSQLIPGHGGVLDRMDGMLSAGLFFALLVIVTRSTVFLWF